MYSYGSPHMAAHELIRDVLLWIPTHGRTKAGRPARTYIQQLCEDTGCWSEDLPRAMNDREEWRERVRDIRATSTRWWWWWCLPYHSSVFMLGESLAGRACGCESLATHARQAFSRSRFSSSFSVRDVKSGRQERQRGRISWYLWDVIAAELKTQTFLCYTE